MILRNATRLCTLGLTVWLAAGCPATRTGSDTMNQPRPPAAPETRTLKLHPLFTDHMVLQRDGPIPVWGWAAPGARIAVELAGRSAFARAGADGRWMARLDPMPAGGPHELTVEASGGDRLVCSDVLVGEVWVASGQSNMEWPLAWSRNGEVETQAARRPLIRLLTVPHQVAASPLDSLETEGWALCSPETAGGFSAVAYFFGCELHQRLGVPVGLINASWGGSSMEAWTPLEDLLRDPPIPGSREEWERWFKTWGWLYQGTEHGDALARWREQTSRTGGSHRDPGRADFTADWAEPVHRSPQWQPIQVPGNWEQSVLPLTDGVVWFRREVTLPEDWAGHPLELRLGRIDDTDTTFFNGVEIGRTPPSPGAWQSLRAYSVPETLVRAGRNVIAVRVMDEGGPGGLIGPAEQMTLAREGLSGPALPLTGEWLYRIECALQQNPLVVGEHPHATPAILYNAMIHPLMPFAVRGVIWYQGESNCARHEQYFDLSGRMIRAWRRGWGRSEFPFLIVQLAGFDVDWPGWVEVREAQARTAREVANVGLATAVDIGEAHDIHPKNKQEVGRRLALAARALVYGEDVEYSGPVARTAWMARGVPVPQNQGVVVTFDHADGGLATEQPPAPATGAVAAGRPAPQEGEGAPLRGFELVGSDGLWHPADARIQGDRVFVWSASVDAPHAVRYNWRNWPDGNLYNRAGLPALPFCLDVNPAGEAGKSAIKP
ncbi:MAG: sialate O-acetylesterase [Candidatus Sumerlaeia bacterium]